MLQEKANVAVQIVGQSQHLDGCRNTNFSSLIGQMHDNLEKMIWPNMGQSHIGHGMLHIRIYHVSFFD